MSQDREAHFRKMVADFPNSAMSHFSLGRHLLEGKRFDEAAVCFEEAVRLQADYAAALLALGDSYAASGKKDRAREVFEKAREYALAQSHPGLAEDITQRIDAL